MKNLRQTGRTTRMLNHAIEEALLGKLVVVLAPSYDLVNVYREQIEVRRPFLHTSKWWTVRVRCIADCSGHEAKFQFNWQSMKFNGLPPAAKPMDGPCWNNTLAPNAVTVVLVDHYCIEERFGRAFTHMHQFDLEES